MRMYSICGARKEGVDRQTDESKGMGAGGGGIGRYVESEREARGLRESKTITN